jgi:hypothetical protein
MVSVEEWWLAGNIINKIIYLKREKVCMKLRESMGSASQNDEDAGQTRRRAYHDDTRPPTTPPARHPLL